LKNRLINLLKLFISIGLLAFLSRLVDWHAAWEVLKAMHWGYLGLAFLLFQLTFLLRSYRWRALLDALDTHVPIPRLLYLYYVGGFFNTFLPSGFGGDAIKMYELNRYSHRPSEAIGTVLVDRLAGIIVLLAMGVLAWPFVYRALPAREAAFTLGVSCAGLVASWVLFQRRLVEWLLKFLPERVGAPLRRLYTAVHTCGTRALWRALGISIVFNLALFLMTYVIAIALGQRIPFIYFVAFMPIISLSMLIPSVGALGTREGAYVLLFGSAGVPQHVAVAMSLGFYLVNVLTGVIGAVLYAIAAVRGMGKVRDKEAVDGSVDRRARIQ